MKVRRYYKGPHTSKSTLRNQWLAQKGIGPCRALSHAEEMRLQFMVWDLRIAEVRKENGRLVDALEQMKRLAG
jgi:hypothetical protein